MARGGKQPGAGRPKGSTNKATAEVKELARQYGAGAIDQLAKLAGLAGRRYTAKAEAAQVAAIKEILDRGYGKATQPIGNEEGKAFLLDMIERKIVNADNRDR